MEAFDRACREGYGIELDVQLSSDDVVMVFHDEDLERMTGKTGRMSERTCEELQSLHLANGGHIPTFQDVLATVNGRTPLLVEVKACRKNSELCRRTIELLRSYPGAYLVESFNPLTLLWLRRNAPDIVRGQLISPASIYAKAKMPLIVSILLSTLSLNFLTRPDFIAYDLSKPRYLTPKLQRKFFHIPMAEWTVRDQATFEHCLVTGEKPIFEGVIPTKK